MEIHPVEGHSTRGWLDFPPASPKWLDGNPTILKLYWGGDKRTSLICWIFPGILKLWKWKLIAIHFNIIYLEIESESVLSFTPILRFNQLKWETRWSSIVPQLACTILVPGPRERVRICAGWPWRTFSVQSCFYKFFWLVSWCCSSIFMTSHGSPAQDMKKVVLQSSFQWWERW